MEQLKQLKYIKNITDLGITTSERVLKQQEDIKELKEKINILENNILNTETIQKNKIYVQDRLVKKYNLTMRNQAGRIKKRFYYDGKYILVENPCYYNILNSYFNELMENYTFKDAKIKLRAFSEELKLLGCEV